MKKLFGLFVLIAYATLAVANIPAGKTIYFDFSQHWKGAPSYLLYLSQKAWVYPLSPVAGQEGLYSFTTKESTQDDLCFGPGYQVEPTDFGTANGLDRAKVSITLSAPNYWSEEKPYYIVDDELGHGHWADGPYVAPSNTTEAEHQLQVCIGEKLTLQSSYDDADHYVWSSTPATVISTQEKSYSAAYTESVDVTVQAMIKTRSADNNLMANGDFESNPPIGFESDYQYLSWDPENMYDHDGMTELYVISQSAGKVCVNFMNLTAHSGKYFMLVDGGDTRKDVWRASYTTNPNLKVVKGQTYHFSYWAANVNIPSQSSVAAKLQFRISLDGGATYTDLGAPFSLQGLNDGLWHYNEVQYTATESSDQVVIAVSDITVTTNPIGNDFALDDILFQPADSYRDEVAFTDLFHVVAKACDGPVTQYETLCLGESVTLQSAYDKEHYRWKVDGQEVGTESYFTFMSDIEGLYHVTCEPYNDSTELNDAMKGANGDFESGYTGFTSDFLPITKNGTPVVNPTSIYSGKYDNGTWSPDGKVGYYMITNNAQTLQSDASIFKPIKPHGGSEFLLVDAYAAGYAWKVENLTVVPGTTYEFSYWATTPNARTYELGFKAELQFIITYKDKYGFFEEKELLDEPHVLGTEAGDEKWQWHQRKVTWTAPADVVSVTIGVKDLNTSAEGNDFCLDDIVFMPQGQPESAIVERFDITVEECECEGVQQYSMWNNVVFVDNYDSLYVDYQWYRDSVAVEGARLQYFHETLTDNVEHRYYCIMHDASGVEYYSCETTIAGAEPSRQHPNGDHAGRKVAAKRRYYVGGNFYIDETIYDDGSAEYVKGITL